MILAAGRGDRLRPITDTVPKSLMPVGNAPVLAHHLDALARIGLRRVIVNVSHLAEPIARFLGDGSRWGLELVMSYESVPAGTGGALARVRDTLSREEEFLVINADIVHGYDLEAVVAHRRAHGADACVVIRRVPASFPNALGVKGDAVVYVPGCADPQGEAVDFAGIHVLTPAILDGLPRTGSIFHDGYVPLLSAGHRVVAFDDPAAPWADIGTVERLLEANIEWVRSQRADRVVASARPPVFIGEEVVLAEGCVVGPEVVIGARASIGAGATVSHTLILPGGDVPAGSTIDRAIVYTNGVAFVDEQS